MNCETNLHFVKSVTKASVGDRGRDPFIAYTAVMAVSAKIFSRLGKNICLFWVTMITIP